MANVKAVFRKDKEGVVFAMFPHEAADNSGHCTSYDRVGGHSAADYNGCMRASKPAKPEEYAPILGELESRGYTVQVVRGNK